MVGKIKEYSRDYNTWIKFNGNDPVEPRAMCYTELAECYDRYWKKDLLMYCRCECDIYVTAGYVEIRCIERKHRFWFGEKCRVIRRFKLLDDKHHVLIYMVKESIADDCIIDRSTSYNPHDGTPATVGIIQG